MNKDIQVKTKVNQNPINIMEKRGVRQVITATVGLAIICIGFSLINENFYSRANIANLLRQIAPILLIGIAESFVLITGNFDLSIGSIVGVSAMFSGTLMSRGILPPIATVFVTMTVCLIIGLVNGILVAHFKVPAFIATLGTMTISRGLAQLVNNNYNTDAITKFFPEQAEAFKNVFYYGKTLGIYNGVVISILCMIIFSFILSSTKSGRHMYAVGSNAESARMSGVNVTVTICKAYIISAFCSCIVGFITCATVGQGTMDAGGGYEMYAVAASVIGGVSTLGGYGLLIGTSVGAAIWGVLQNGLQFAGAPIALRNIVIGIIVVLSVMLDIFVQQGKGGKKSKSSAKAN